MSMRMFRRLRGMKLLIWKWMSRWRRRRKNGRRREAKAEDGAGSDSTEQSGQMQMPPDMDSTEMPQGAPGGMSDMTGETVTTMIPVGVTVHTTSDTTTTFSRLASGDLLKILVETDSDGNEVIEEIWMLQ